MAYQNVNMAETQAKIDWDNVDVGNNHLDHSENFFAKRHFGHERFDAIEIEIQQCADDNDERSELFDIEEQFEGIKIEIVNVCDAAADEDENKENIDETITIKEEPVTSPEDVKHKPTTEEKTTLDLSVKPSAQARKIVNLASQWSTQKPISCKSVTASKGAIPKSMPPPPQAYLVKDLYQRKREEAERRRLEEERKRREFHPRPVPNFIACHELIEKRKSKHLYTMAITPQVLKKSKEAEEKRRKKLEEWKKNNKAPKFESRPPTVLKEKPFVPLKKPSVIQQAPFNLNTEKRLMERKHYDVSKQKMLEEKKKQVEIEEEERKRLEEERIRELRKAATFKARPNPFKH